MSYYTIRCEECEGAGLVLKKEKDDRCPCCNDFRRSCMRCENIKFKGVYTECSACLGLGELWFDANTKEQVDIATIPRKNYNNINIEKQVLKNNDKNKVNCEKDGELSLIHI